MPLRILVVEDYEPFLRYVCSTLAQKAEYQIIGQAADGSEAIQKAEELQPDLVLLDIGLPKMNGFEAVSQIRKLAPYAKILFLSQEFAFDMVERALRLGALGYVHKLRAHGELLPALETIVQNKYFVSGILGGGFGDSPINKSQVRHEVQFYSDDEVLLESFTDFVGATLKADKTAILVASEPLRAGVLERLTARSVDVEGAIRAGTLIPVDNVAASSEIMLNEMPDPGRFFDVAHRLIEAAAKGATSAKNPQVAVCRESPSRLLAEGKMAQLLQLEQLWELLAHRSILDILCGYALAGFEKHEDIFEKISAGHSATHSR